MKGFFNPGSVAVAGVSARPDNLGRIIADNLDTLNFQGPVYYVNPRGGELKGRPIYRDILELPETPEAAVILTPARTVPDLMRRCGEKGIKRIIIETAGFGELSVEGSAVEKELTAIANEYGMRFIGPNCIGVVSTESGFAVPFTLIGEPPPKGGVSIVAQSGGVGLTYLHGAVQGGLGIAKFATMGNKLNVNEQDLLAYLVEDPQTQVILLYLESITRGREVFELIRKCPKPVLVHKSNVAESSHQIAHSHTAALANDDAVVDAALAQAGAIRSTSVLQTLNLLKGLCLPRPRGRRVAVISRSGGHAVVAADALHKNGHKLAPMPQEYFDAIQEHTRAAVIKLQNPLDLGDLFQFDVYRDILEGALSMDTVDTVLMIHGYRGPEIEASRRFVAKAGELSFKHQKPTALVLLTTQEELAAAQKNCELPIFPAPDEGLEALDAATRHVEALARLAAQKAEQTAKLDEEWIKRLIRFPGPDGELELPEALLLAQSLGISVASFIVAADPGEAAACARELGFPVVLKAVAVGISHKTDRGGVRLNLNTPAQVEAAAQEMVQSLAAGRLVVMKQVQDPCVELILGGKHDPAFGPLVLLGLGGVTAELLKDITLRLAPIGEIQAGSMVDDLKGAPLLKGFRGRTPADLPALITAITKVAALMSRFPQIRELDLNPILAGPEGAVAVDARVRIEG